MKVTPKISILSKTMLTRQTNTHGVAICNKCRIAFVDIDIGKEIITKRNSKNSKWWHKECGKYIL